MSLLEDGWFWSRHPVYFVEPDPELSDGREGFETIEDALAAARRELLDEQDEVWVAAPERAFSVDSERIVQTTVWVPTKHKLPPPPDPTEGAVPPDVSSIVSASLN